MFDEALQAAGGYGPAGIFNDPGVDWYHGFAPSLQVYKPMLDNPAMYAQPSQTVQPPPLIAARPTISTPEGISPESIREAVQKASIDTNSYYDAMQKVLAGAQPYMSEEKLRLAKEHTPSGLDIPWPDSITVSPDVKRAYFEPPRYIPVFNWDVGDNSINLSPIDVTQNDTVTRSDVFDGYLPVWSGGSRPGSSQVLSHELGHFYDWAGLYGEGEGMDAVFDPLITANTVSILNTDGRTERSKKTLEDVLRYGVREDEGVWRRPHEPWADQFGVALRLTAQGELDPRVVTKMGITQPDVDRLSVEKAGDIYDIKGLFGDPKNREKSYNSLISRQDPMVPWDVAESRRYIQRALLYDVLRRPLGYPSAIQQPPPPPDDGVFRVKATTTPKR